MAANVRKIVENFGNPAWVENNCVDNASVQHNRDASGTDRDRLKAHLAGILTVGKKGAGIIVVGVQRDALPGHQRIAATVRSTSPVEIGDGLFATLRRLHEAGAEENVKDFMDLAVFGPNEIDEDNPKPLVTMRTHEFSMEVSPGWRMSPGAFGGLVTVVDHLLVANNFAPFSVSGVPA